MSSFYCIPFLSVTHYIILQGSENLTHKHRSSWLLKGMGFDAFTGVWELDLLAATANTGQQSAEAALKAG